MRGVRIWFPRPSAAAGGSGQVGGARKSVFGGGIHSGCNTQVLPNWGLESQILRRNTSRPPWGALMRVSSKPPTLGHLDRSNGHPISETSCAHTHTQSRFPPAHEETHLPNCEQHNGNKRIGHKRLQALGSMRTPSDGHASARTPEHHGVLFSSVIVTFVSPPRSS